MAERLRYINTASSPGGDGTTNNTSGSTRAYASRAEAESAEQAALTGGSLIVAGDTLRFVFEGTDTATCTWAGILTDSTHYITIETASAQRHTGNWTTGAGTVSTTNANAEVVEVDHFRSIGIQYEVTETGGTAPRIVILADNQGSGSLVRYDSALIRKNANTTNGTCHGVRVNSALCKFVLVNSIVYDFNQTSARGFDLQTTGGDAFVYNCGFQNCTQGIRDTYGVISSGHFHVKNTWADSCTDGFDTLGSWGTGTDYNISSNASDAPGSTVKNSASISFVNAGSDDFHLASGDTVAKGWGLDLSADSDYAFSNDIDGSTRSGQWDAGPDQYVSSGGGSVSSVFRSLLGVGV